MSNSPGIIHQLFSADVANPNDLRTIVAAFKRIEVSRNQYIIKEGDLVTHYQFVESGFLRSFAIDTSGNDITTGFFAPNQIVWEVASLFLGTPTKENIQTLEDCVLWQINLEEFHVLFNTIPEFREAGRTRLVQNHVELKYRSLSMITDSAETRYLQLMKEHPEILKLAPLKHIATYLGITDSSLSRIRKEVAGR
jgi:CRP-like cAMP-binding protein